MKRAYKRRKSVKALAGAGRDVVLGCVATAGGVTLGCTLLGMRFIVKRVRLHIGPPLHGKELLVYEAAMMASLLAIGAPLAWTAGRAADARYVTHQLLGLKPPRRKRPKPMKVERRL